MPEVAEASYFVNKDGGFDLRVILEVLEKFMCRQERESL